MKICWTFTHPQSIVCLFAVPNWLKWFALRGPELTQMIRAPRSRTDSNDSRSAVPNWLKWFALRGPKLTQMIRAPRSRTDSNDSRSAVPELTQMIRAPRSQTDSNDSRAAVSNWLKWFAPRWVSNWLKWFALRGPKLTQMIRAPRSRTGLELTQMIRAPRSQLTQMIRAPRSRTGLELTQMIRAPRSQTDSNDSRSAVSNWSRTDSNDSRSAVSNWSRTDSNDSRSAVPNWLKWFALRGLELELTQMIRAPRSRTGLELTQMIRAPRSQTDSNDSLRGLETDSNDSRSAVSNWSRTDSNDSAPRSTQMTLELTQMIRAPNWLKWRAPRSRTDSKRKITHRSWLKIFNTVALIGINLYSVLFLYLFIQFLECAAKYTYCTWN